MSLRALNIAATGLLGHGRGLDLTSNNLANLTTDGFKRSRGVFADLVNRGVGGIGPSASFGLGTQLTATQLDFAQGPIRPTERELDVAITGPGFFSVRAGDGAERFTRAGNFTLNADGELVLPTPEGSLPLQPPIRIPADATGVSIGSDGTVSVTRGNDGEAAIVGQLEAARFVNPEGLEQLGSNLFAASGASGAANVGPFGQDGFGSLQQGALEGANVEPAQELVALITNQRAFELSSEAFRAANENLRLVTNLNS